jgi:hypothetical protein
VADLIGYDYKPLGFGVKKKPPDPLVLAQPPAAVLPPVEPPTPSMPGVFFRNEALAEEARAKGLTANELRVSYALKRGAIQDRSIETLQRQLAGEGFYNGRLDGIMGPQTQAAISAYHDHRAQSDQTLIDKMNARSRTNFIVGSAVSGVNSILYRQKLRSQAEALAAQKANALKRGGVLGGQLWDKTGNEAILKQVNKYLKDASLSADQLKAVSDAVAKYQSDASAAQNKRNSRSWLQKTKDAALGGVADVFGKIETVTEPAQRAYYAAKRVELTGGSVADQLSAFGGALPGLGFTAKGSRRTAIEETNTRAEREVLTKKGELASFMSLMSGKALDTLKGEALTHYEKGIKFSKAPLGYSAPGRDVSTALGDFAFQIATDPTTYLTGGGVHELSNVGEQAGKMGLEQSAKRAGMSGLGRITERGAAEVLGTEGVIAAKREGRQAFLRTGTGRRLMEAAADVITKGGDAKEVRAAIRGIDETVAQNIAKATSKTEAMTALKEAFVSGEWSPHITVRRQALGAVSGKGLGVAGGAGLGRAVIRESEGAFDVIGKVRRASRPVGEALATTSRSAIEAMDNALAAGLARYGAHIDDFYDEVVAPLVQNEDVWGRFSRLADKAAELNIAGVDDVLENFTKKVLPKDAASPTAWQQAFAKIGDSQELRQLETLFALADGSAGPAASAQVALELKSGFKSADSRLTGIVARASNNVTGRTVPEEANGRLANTAKNRQTLRADVIGRLGGSDDANMVRRALLDEIQVKASLGKNSTLTSLRNSVDLLVHPDVIAETAGLLRRTAQRAEDEVASIAVQRRALTAPLRGLGAVFNSLTESVAPNKVAFLGYENDAIAIKMRVEALDRYAAELGMDDFQRSLLRRTAGDVATEEELANTVNDMLGRMAKREGVPEELLLEVAKENQQALKQGKATLVDQAGGDVSEKVMVLAQRGEAVALPDPDDVRRTIREYKAAQPGNFGAKARSAVSKVADTPFLGLKSPFTGDALSFRSIALKIHRQWKFTVVVNPYLFAVGATAGFLGTDGDLGDKAKGAAIGSAVGLLGPVRYIARVAGLEEGLRKFIDRGMTPDVWLPHYGRFVAEDGVDLPFRTFNAVRAGDPIGSRYQRLLETAGGEFEALHNPRGNPIAKLGRKESRFLDGWQRIINYQVHPETDAVMDILLREKGRVITSKEADGLLQSYLQSENGKVWYKRMKAAFQGPSSKAEAVARYRQFLEAYVPEEVAAKRIEGAVTTDVLKTAVKEGTSPEYIHAEKSWLLPRSSKQIFHTRDELLRKTVFEGPTSRMNREPMARSIYGDEYRRLRSNGVAAERAQEIAEQVAVDRTNKVMFRVDDESRFAKRVDFVFPFQQPREELFRVWGSLLTNNKARAIKVTHLVALALNNGQEHGVFQKDFNGDYVMTIPGSAWLGDKLFGAPNGFDFRLKDLLFFGQGAYGVNIIPSPGGPYWSTASRLYLNQHPDWYEKSPDWMKEWLFPYGSQGNLFRPETSRLWMSWLGKPPPWEFAAQFEMENQFAASEKQMYLLLRYQHAQKTGDWEWEPSTAEVDQAVSSHLRAWAFFGSFFPAGPKSLLPYKDALAVAQQAYKDPVTGEFDFPRFMNENPYWAPYMVSHTDFVGPDTYDSWSQSQAQRADDYILHRRKEKPFSKWKAELADNERVSTAYQERSAIFLAPDADRSAMFQAWEQKYPDLAEKTRSNYFRDYELVGIEHMANGPARESALDNWRKRYNVSFTNYKRLSANALSGKYKYDPWKAARASDDVVTAVDKQVKRGIEEDTAVSVLSPAEQVKYWKHKVAEVDYMKGEDPQAVIDEYYKYKGKVSDVYRNYGTTLLTYKAQRGDFPSPTEVFVDKWRGDYRQAINDLYSEVNRVNDAKAVALAKKDWKSYYALKAKRDAMYDQIEALKNKQYQELPAMDDLQTELKAVMSFVKPGTPLDEAKYQVAGMIRNGFLPSNEMATYLAMSDDVRRAYVDDLVNGLNIKPAPGETFAQGRKFWEWLTDFQRDLLSKNLPEDMLANWKAEHPADASKATGPGTGNEPGGLRGIDAELKYAYEQFRLYNKRTTKNAPAAYKTYLALPNNQTVRGDFLRQHPEVKNWIASGPMANMPPAMAMIVANIMIKNGKWKGEELPIQSIEEISFAREQMARWTKRAPGSSAPAAYDAWVNMPTGVEKADYLKAHPEIQDWIRLGPMTNMPEAYRDVVRDIMYRYGIWSASDDALGNTIAEYYRTPGYARKAFLDQHPELVEYWKLTRDPAESAMFALSDQYFAIPDINAKRSFLSAHPELQQWFLDRRQKRYEDFLNKVAVYMGANPQLFEHYLTRQQDVLAELLNKFAQPVLVKEQFRTNMAKPAKTRQRDAA